METRLGGVEKRSDRLGLGEFGKVGGVVADQ
jgi:hypothetical protein